MEVRASKLVRELEDENEWLAHQNRHLKTIIYRLVTKHGNAIDLSPMDEKTADTIAASQIFLSEADSTVQILSKR